MTELSEIFERLGLSQYLERFIEEGFDTWETVLYATESDLEALEVKLGHRRKLQKEIASARDINIEQVIGAVVRNASSTDDLLHRANSENRSVSSLADAQIANVGPAKRKYRRHPKPDDHAPERPPSAYVIFSNKIREELKPQKLSFADIAKTVGERWQLLDPDEKDHYENQASTAKEQYSAALSKYKRTTQFREYQKYLVDFKARNTPQSTSTGSKRPKLEIEVGTTKSESSSSLAASLNDSDIGRKASISSQPTTISPPVSSANSPTILSRLATAASAVTTQSRESSIQSSIPNTPVNVAFTPLSSSAPLLLSGQRGYDNQIHQLPRIFTLDGRDPRANIASLVTEPISLTNPRRSMAGSPAAFLRQDTSKSSTSSILSKDSTGSSVYTPITPQDENRSSRSLPPLATLTHHGSIEGSQSIESDRRGSQVLPTRFTTDLGERTPKSGQGYSQSFHHLSIHSEAPDVQRVQPLPPFPDLSAQTQSSRSDTTTRNIPPDHPSSSRMDPLSVLALAGRMVDNEFPNPGRTDKSDNINDLTSTTIQRNQPR